MLSLEMHYLVYQEQHQDRLRDLKYQQLLQAARLQGVSLQMHQTVATWLGAQMVKWGSKLESYGTTSPSKPITVEIQQR